MKECKKMFYALFHESEFLYEVYYASSPLKCVINQGPFHLYNLVSTNKYLFFTLHLSYHKKELLAYIFISLLTLKCVWYFMIIFEVKIFQFIKFQIKFNSLPLEFKE